MKTVGKRGRKGKGRKTGRKEKKEEEKRDGKATIGSISLLSLF